MSAQTMFQGNLAPVCKHCGCYTHIDIPEQRHFDESVAQMHAHASCVEMLEPYYVR